ncbi:hypothetical protein WBG78_19130 [Chryseolinea sp. T2]|uniref:hypothetical protein n=1 Tax=Chryseolinea sp. T2 TaxID=3129255 RepID=UPI003076C6DA
MVVGRNYTSVACVVACVLAFAASLIPIVSYSQKITNVDFEVVGDKVDITYDIEDCSGDKTYDLRVMLGMDGQLMEIERGLKGDVESVDCGSSKRITWDVLSDREELAGKIYFAVEIYRTHNVIVESPSYNERTERDKRKEWASRSWKADKGYVGGSLGMFSSMESYSNAPRSLMQGGMFVNASIGYLPSLLLGVSTTVYIYSDPKENAFNVKTWKNWGVMIGPLISLPLGNRIKWELKPQVGYSAISVKSDMSLPDSLSVMRAGVACNIGAGLRLNLGKRTCYMLNVEYMSAPIRFDDYPVDANLGTIGASFGIAFRFY